MTGESLWPEKKKKETNETEFDILYRLHPAPITEPWQKELGKILDGMKKGQLIMIFPRTHGKYQMFKFIETLIDGLNMPEKKKTLSGKMVISQALIDDLENIEAYQEKISIANAYFEDLKREKPKGLKVHRFSGTEGEKLLKALEGTPWEVKISIGRKSFVAAYSEKENTIGYVELMGVTE